MNNKRKALVAILSAFALSTAGAALMTGCKNKTVGHIDAPSSIEADLGTYVIPDYDVVDDNGMILAGYNVYLKSVKDANGEEISVNSYGSVTVDTAGVYSFVYSAGNKKVKDVTVSIDFADRTAPTINYDERNLPDFYIRGNEYKMPAYTLSGDFVREKCWAKVYYVAEDNTETEVKIESGRFKVDKEKGSYAIRVHVEDAVGNANDYEYVRKVDGPATLVENRVLYFNEEFGARQVSCYEDSYKGEYVSKDTAGAQVYGEEEGAYKVTFDGVTKTQNNEGYISMRVPALINLYEYERLEMWVYNDSGKNIFMGSNWWNDTEVENGKWTKLVWNTREWGGVNGNKDVTNQKYIGVTDISGMVIRFIFDYGQKVIPNGTFYFSSMNAVPKVPAEIAETECETEGGGVVFDQTKYYINDTVNLSAKKVEGKVINCYKVDGEVIPGNSFTVTKENHTVEAVYATDPLTLDNMTWATPTNYTLVGDDAQTYKLGEGKKWVLTYDVYDIGDGWNYFAAYVGGPSQLLGFELAGQSGKFCAYGSPSPGGEWKWIDGVALSPEILDVLKSATSDKPATIKYIRDDNLVKTFVEYDKKSYFVATVDIVETLGCRSGNSFGIGGRGAGGINNVPVHEIRAVEGETKTELVHATYPATVKGDDVCVFEDKAYRVGDTVTLSAPAEKEGKLLLCYKVNGVNIAGNSFAISESTVSVEAYYTDPCTVTLAEGLSVDGQTGEIVVPTGKVITVMYTGTSPDNQYFAGVLVDGQPYTGGEITITESISVTVKYENRVPNDNEKLNDISEAAGEGGIVYDSENPGWKPTSIEYVNDFGYDGSDATVDAKNTLKVTLSGDEQAFALDNGVGDLGKYSDFYFYAYTEASGLEMGSWWCNDTPLVAGKWTLVKFDRTKAAQNVSKQNVWEHGLNQFIYRIMKGKSGDVVYVTAVYGVPFADVTVEKATDSSDYLEISDPKYGEKHKINETVTLTCTGAPENKAFVCFTVNGVAIDGRTYTLTDTSVKFGIRFEDTSTITVDDGIEIEGVTAGADGKYIVGKGAKIKLSYTGTPESEKIFDYFLVDGTTKIYDDAFTTTLETHTIEAKFAASKADITWGAGDTTRYTKEKVMGNTATSGWFDNKFGKGQIFGSSQHWAIKVNAQTTYETTDKGIQDAWNAITFVTGSKESLLMRWYGSGNYFAFCKIDEKGNENAPTGTDLDLPFVVGLEENRTREQIAFRAKMQGKLNAGCDIIVVRDGTVIKVYADNELVLTVNNAIDCTGDWFGICTGFDKTAPTVEGISFITGEEKVEAYLETAGVIKAQAGVDGSVVKYTGTEYTVPTATATNMLGAALSAPVTTVVKNAKGETLELTDGKITIPKYEGVQYITVTYSATGCKNVTVKVSLQKDGSDVLMAANEFGAATIDAYDGNTVSYDTANAYVGEAGSIKVKLAKSETAIIFSKADLDGYRFLEFYISTDADNVQTGAWWNQDTAVPKGSWKKVIIDLSYEGINLGGGAFPLRLGGTWNSGTGEANNVVGANIYISSVKLLKETKKSSDNQLNNITTAVTYDGDGANLTVVNKSEVTAPISDENVTESKLLKVEAVGNELALRVCEVYTSSLDAYKEVYFWVYVEDPQNDSGTMQGGTHWCGNTNLSAGWTKITITRDTNWAWADGPVENGVPSGVGGQNPYTSGAGNFVYRLMNGAGKTMYITSLYGEPKTTT